MHIIHKRGPLLEETAYYAFGLTMAGISSKAANSLENKRKFNGGTEMECREFSDGSGLEIYSTSYRSYDPQLGRFHQEDPLAGAFEDQSQYNYVSNNPLIFNDPSGLSEQTPGVNSKDPNDIAILEEVTVKNKPKPKFNWLGYPSSTSSHRKEWKENQHLYYTRQSTSQPINQKGDPSSYSSSVGMYKNWDKAEKENKQMSIGAVVAIASPVLIMAAPEIIAATEGAATSSAAAINTAIINTGIDVNVGLQLISLNARNTILTLVLRYAPLSLPATMQVNQMIISGPKTIDISYGSLFSILRGIISARDYFSSSKIFPSGSFPGKETVYPSSAANPK